jgi:CRISPR-associated endonuclease Csy4
MDYYLDIHILPDPEFKKTVLMNAIYSKLHKALCDLHSTSIGVSFPKYEVTLGNVLRIHGKESALNDLQGQNWLGGMSGYCNVSDVRRVPADTKFRTVSRKQTTMSQSKLNRLIKRGSISEEDIKKYKAKMFSKGLDNPYIELASGSNGHKHRRYIEFGELQDNPVAGEFDQFGLSKTATVPWFD